MKMLVKNFAKRYQLINKEINNEGKKIKIKI